MVEYKTVQSHLTQQLLKDNITGVYKDELSAFVHVQSQHLVRKGKVCYVNVPGTKPELVKQSIELKDAAYSTPLYPECLVFPQ